MPVVSDVEELSPKGSPEGDGLPINELFCSRRGREAPRYSLSIRQNIRL